MTRIACPKCRSQFELDRWTEDSVNVSCSECGAAFNVGQNRVSTVKLKKVTKRRSAGDTLGAFIVSLIIPGLGHAVKGRKSDGAIWFAVALGSVVLCIATGIFPVALVAYGAVAIISAVGSLAV